MGKYTEKLTTFQAGEALLKYRRVKVLSGTTTDPVQVHYADASEQAIGVVDADTASGSLVAVWVTTTEGCAADSFSRGATLYAAASGKISDTSSGSAIGIALEAATASGDIVEWAPYGVLSTTAATVSYADAAGQTSAATVEALGAEILTDLLSAQSFIGIPLNQFRETTNFDVGNIAANGGVLASDTTPILEAINAATDGCQRFNWASGEVDQITCQISLPPDLDTTADIKLYTRIASEGTTDAVGFTVDTFFNEGDTKVVDTSATNQTVTYADKLTTIAAADIPAAAAGGTMTIGLTPVAHTTDKMYMTGCKIYYTRALLTS